LNDVDCRLCLRACLGAKRIPGVRTENLNPDVMVMKPA
jgi:hypothetical protein